jgi:2-amino-4-hydroxy-6-hydroxymethyldihydropteridine diphosphokinase
LGRRRSLLAAAIKEIGEFAQVLAVSSFHDTEPEGFRDQPRFLNAAVKIRCPLTASEILIRAKRIEIKLGRVPAARNGPRAIDIDLLDVRGEIFSSPGLTLPHPRMHRRRFVLAPLLEISPRWKHPLLGLSVRDLLQRLGA